MLKRLALCLGLVLSIVILLPLATSTAHNLRSQIAARSYRFRHHSRAWWRRHRAMIRRRQAMMARRRALQAVARNSARPQPSAKTAENHVVVPTALALPESVYRDSAASLPLPTNWSAVAAYKGSSNFRIAAPKGLPEAQATLAVVAEAPPPTVRPLPSEQKRMLGGVALTDLRRSVIDKMIVAGGWVINDRARYINGQRVFEVIAQTPAMGEGKPEQVWNFYFTEVNGRVYSLTTRSVNGATPKVSADAEQFLSNFRPIEPKR